MTFRSLTKHSPSLLLSALSVIAAHSCLAQTLTITSGQGQIAANSSLAPQSLTVQLLDATGKPFPNQLITFTDTQGGLGGYVNPVQGVTDANGMASTTFVGATVMAGTFTSYVQTNIVAAYNGLFANFYETTSGIVGTGGGNALQVNVLSPQIGQPITGGAGSTSSIPIKVQINSVFSTGGVPNVAITVVSDPTSTGSVMCKEGSFVLTDATGNATCTPVFGRVGSGTYAISVGGGYFLTNNTFQFTTTVGAPGMIVITSGANQSGLPGDRLPLPIVAVVSDLAGNIIQGAQVVFETIPAGAATFTQAVTVSDPNGRVSAYVVLGTSPGPFQVRIRDVGNLVTNPPTVTETVNITISGLNKVSGDGQTAFINAAFGGPLVVKVANAVSQPVASATVNFVVTSGSATVSPSSALTAADGTASTTVTAGATAGPITITATAGAFSQTFTLTANPLGPTNFSYSNGASFVPNQISPGAIVNISAQGLLSANVQGVVGGTLVGALPYTVAGVSVTIDNIPAPIFNVSNLNGTQTVTVQIPFEVRATTVPITISVNGGGSTSAFVTVLPLAPGIFETTQTDGRRRAVALRPNGTVVTQSNPAGRGENIRIYLTGLGAVTPSVPTGTFSTTGSDPAITGALVAGINSGGVPIVQAIYARNLIGVYELTITVPTDTVAFPSGTVALSVAVQGPNGSYVYSNPSAIAIQ